MFQFPGFQHRLHCDLESYSECDIKRAGARKYASDPSTEILIFGYAFDDGPVLQWLPHEGAMPLELRVALDDPNTSKLAFNAAFERSMIRDVLGVNTAVEQWRCTMICAYYLGFMGGLDAVLAQTGLKSRKDPRGQRLIQTFSTPNPRNYKQRRYTWEDKPAEFQEFCEYNIQDVEVERELLLWLAKYPMMADFDWQRYALDQRINDRGTPVDVRMAEGANEIWSDERKRLERELRIVTGLPKVTRGPFLEWLQEQGVDVATTRKDELAVVEAPNDAVAQALSLWGQKEAKATAKYNAVLNGAQDGRVKGMFQFKGASRTDRTAGRRLQLQNLKRPFCKNEAEIDTYVKAIRTGNADLLRMIADRPVSDVLGGCVRHVIQGDLVVQDLTSIESVVLGWLTHCDKILDTFRHGHDTYKVFATGYYGIPYDQVTKAQRKFCKPPVLGCGYQLGARGLVAYAEAMGVTLTADESARAVDTFRTMYPEVPAFWDWIIRAATEVIKTGAQVEGYHLRLERDDDFLRIWLPSGRALSYFKPEVSARIAPWADVITELDHGDECPLLFARAKFPHLTDTQLVERGVIAAGDWIESVSYMGKNQKTTQWQRIHTFGGSLTENCVQSIAYDILMDGITRAEAAGLPVVLQVHDEIGVEASPDKFDLLGQCLTTLPEWAPDLWLGSAGFTGHYYTKD